jgi:hypothetical protein
MLHAPDKRPAPHARDRSPDLILQGAALDVTGPLPRGRISQLGPALILTVRAGGIAGRDLDADTRALALALRRTPEAGP